MDWIVVLIVLIFILIWLSNIIPLLLFTLYRFQLFLTFPLGTKRGSSIAFIFWTYGMSNGVCMDCIEANERERTHFIS
jgi:hypothetical protein